MAEGWSGGRDTFCLALNIACNLLLTDLWRLSAGAQSRGQGWEDAGVQLTRGHSLKSRKAWLTFQNLPFPGIV